MNKSLATQLFESYIKNREYGSSPYKETRDYILSDKFQKEIIEFNNYFIQEIVPKLKEKSNNQECSFIFKCTSFSYNVVYYVLNSHGFNCETYNENNDNEMYCVVIWGETVFNFFEG